MDRNSRWFDVADDPARDIYCFYKLGEAGNQSLLFVRVTELPYHSLIAFIAHDLSSVICRLCKRILIVSYSTGR